jgi:hypothetical protein
MKIKAPLFYSSVLLLVTGFCMNWAFISPAQGADTLARESTVTADTTFPKPAQAEVSSPALETRVFSIKYAQAQDIYANLQRFVTKYGKIGFDVRTNMIFVSDTPESVQQIDQIIKAMDIPLETLIIPVKFADASDVLRLLVKNTKPQATFSVDTRLNSIIVTDMPSYTAQVKALVEQIDNSLKDRPLIGLDCSIIKVALDEKHDTGIDWSQCPFLQKGMPNSPVYLKNVDFQKLLEWLNKHGVAEMISRKRVTVTPNEETRVREGIRYQFIEKAPIGQDTVGVRIVTKGEESGFIYRFNAKNNLTPDGKGSVMLTFNVDGVIPQGSATVAYSVNVNNAIIENGLTLVNEDIRRILTVNESNPQANRFDNLNIILLMTPFSPEPDAKAKDMQKNSGK